MIYVGKLTNTSLLMLLCINSNLVLFFKKFAVYFKTSPFQALENPGVVWTAGVNVATVMRFKTKT